MLNKCDCWSNLILEIYCARTWSTKKDKYMYEMITDEKGLIGNKFKKILNKDYDSKYKVPKQPNFCRGLGYNCLNKNCPHLTYTNADKEDYELFYKNKGYKI